MGLERDPSLRDIHAGQGSGLRIGRRRFFSPPFKALGFFFGLWVWGVRASGSARLWGFGIWVWAGLGLLFGTEKLAAWSWKGPGRRFRLGLLLWVQSPPKPALKEPIDLLNPKLPKPKM